MTMLMRTSTGVFVPKTTPQHCFSPVQCFFPFIIFCFFLLLSERLNVTVFVVLRQNGDEKQHGSQGTRQFSQSTLRKSLARTIEFAAERKF